MVFRQVLSMQSFGKKRTNLLVFGFFIASAMIFFNRFIVLFDTSPTTEEREEMMMGSNKFKKMKGKSVKILPSPIQEYTALLQESVLKKQNALSIALSENEALRKILSEAAASSASFVIDTVSQATKADLPPPPPAAPVLSLPGEFEIRSKYNFDEPVEINPKNQFLTPGTKSSDLQGRTFEISRMPDGVSVTFRHVESGKYLEMRGRGQSKAWVVMPSCEDPSKDTHCIFELHESKYIYNKVGAISDSFLATACRALTATNKADSSFSRLGSDTLSRRMTPTSTS